MANLTKVYITGILDPGVLKPNDEQKGPNFAAMDRGAFYIGEGKKGKLIDGLAAMQNKGDYNCGLVPVVGDICIFFADIDGVPEDVELDSLLQKTAGYFNAFVKNKTESELEPEDILVFKRADNSRSYHIYIPDLFGYTTKQERLMIWKSVNIAMEEEVIDLSLIHI